jgi:hypothetical protein
MGVLESLRLGLSAQNKLETLTATRDWNSIEP